MADVPVISHLSWMLELLESCECLELSEDWELETLDSRCWNGWEGRETLRQWEPVPEVATELEMLEPRPLSVLVVELRQPELTEPEPTVTLELTLS